MIRLVGGLPGSGKSYYAANFISKFGSYDSLYKTFVLQKEIKVFTNLDDLQIEHTSLDGCYRRYGGAAKFFTVENFTKIREAWPKAHLLVIVDEAQRTIDDDLLKDKDVAFFFQYHRHLGVDIFLLTNDIASCSRKVVGLCEFLIEAQPRSKSFPGMFRYKFKDTKGTQLYTETVKLKQEVFSIYKSFTTDETEKPKNMLKHWAIMAILGITITTIGFKTFMFSFGHRKNVIVGKDGKMTSRPADQPASGPVSGPPPGYRGYTSHPAPAAAAPASKPAAVPVAPAKPAPYHKRVKVARTETKKVLSSPLPSPVAAAPLADIVPGWVVGKSVGIYEVNQHRYVSLNGRLLDSADCKAAVKPGQVMCKADAVALNE